MRWHVFCVRRDGRDYPLVHFETEVTLGRTETKERSLVSLGNSGSGSTSGGDGLHRPRFQFWEDLPAGLAGQTLDLVVKIESFELPDRSISLPELNEELVFSGLIDPE